METYYPGTRVMVFDIRLYKDDKRTPPSVTVQPATVIRWYGKRSKRYGVYPSLIDVRFDHDGRLSEGHFADETYVQVINKEPERDDEMFRELTNEEQELVDYCTTENDYIEDDFDYDDDYDYGYDDYDEVIEETYEPESYKPPEFDYSDIEAYEKGLDDEIASMAMDLIRLQKENKR